MFRFLLSLAALFCLISPVSAGEILTYEDEDTTLEGYLARAEDDNAPLVLIVHQWKGLGDYEKSRADMLAAAGYNAFAIDMYGQGIRPQSADEARAESSRYKGDSDLARRRIAAALDYARTLSGVDDTRMVVIGYCFGGTMALEAARSGADLRGVVSFHGGLSTPAPAQPGAVRAAIQVHHGADDPFVPADEVAAFRAEMEQAGATIEFFAYPGAVHSFTEPGAGDDPTTGAAYHATADRESWAATLDFLKTRLLPAE